MRNKSYLRKLPNIIQQSISFVTDNIRYDPVTKKHKIRKKARKEVIQRCVHWLENTSGNTREIDPAYTQTANGIICKACGAKLNVNIDQKNLEVLNEAVAIVNGFMLSAAIYDLSNDDAQFLLTMKAGLPELVKIYQKIYESEPNKVDNNVTAENPLASIVTPMI